MRRWARLGARQHRLIILGAKSGVPGTALVVEKTTVLPSDRSDPFVNPEHVAAMQEKVYDEDWYSFVPPTIEELAEWRPELTGHWSGAVYTLASFRSTLPWLLGL